MRLSEEIGVQTLPAVALEAHANTATAARWCNYYYVCGVEICGEPLNALQVGTTKQLGDVLRATPSHGEIVPLAIEHVWGADSSRVQSRSNTAL